LRDSVAELDEQRTQAEVLNALVARAANFAPRVVLFVVKGASGLAWAARGFEETVGNNAIRGLSVSLQSDTVLQSVLNSQQTFYGSPDEQSENTLIFSRFGNINPQRVLAVPLRVRGKSAAVLYADSADRGEGATNVEGIELLVYTAGLVVELVSLRARMSEGPQGAVKQPATGILAQTPPAATSAAQTPQESGDLARTSGSLSQAQSGSGELHQQSASAPSYFRPTTPYPPQPVEPPPVEPQAVAQPPSEPAPLPPEPEPAPSARGEEEKLHNDARRFARLLVSEIKLYNEQKVAEGRRNNDLYDRLKEDIDRSRQMYDKRVTQSVASRFDYFYDELVNTLAEGDAEKLGSDCPGPAVGV
jgi:hypothetical protein